MLPGTLKVFTLYVTVLCFTGTFPFLRLGDDRLLLAPDHMSYILQFPLYKVFLNVPTILTLIVIVEKCGFDSQYINWTYFQSIAQCGTLPPDSFHIKYFQGILCEDDIINGDYTTYISQDMNI